MSAPRNVDALQLSANTLRAAPLVRVTNLIWSCQFVPPGTPPLNVRALARVRGMAFCNRFAQTPTLGYEGMQMRCFASGNMNGTGPAACEMGARLVAHRCVGAMVRAGLRTSVVSRFRVSSVTCCCATGYPVDLGALQSAYPTHCAMALDVFPGLMFYVPGTSVCVKVALTGRCNISGARSRAHAQHCWAWLYLCVLPRFHRRGPCAALGIAEYRAELLQRRGSLRAYCATGRVVEWLRAPRGVARGPLGAVQLPAALTEGAELSRDRLAGEAWRGHSLRCPAVQRPAGDHAYFAQLLEPTADVRAVVQQHVEAGCMSAPTGEEEWERAIGQLARSCRAQLRVIAELTTIPVASAAPSAAQDVHWWNAHQAARRARMRAPPRVAFRASS